MQEINNNFIRKTNLNGIQFCKEYPKISIPGQVIKLSSGSPCKRDQFNFVKEYCVGLAARAEGMLVTF